MTTPIYPIPYTIAVALPRRRTSHADHRSTRRAVDEAFGAAAAQLAGITDQRTFTFVLVETDAGLTGLGDAYGDQVLMPTIVERRLRPHGARARPLPNRCGLATAICLTGILETGGSVLCGISAIEVACWDIRGQAEGVPVPELLGGRRREWIEAYASDLHWEDPGVGLRGQRNGRQPESC